MAWPPPGVSEVFAALDLVLRFFGRHAAVGVAHLVKRGIFHAECEQSLVLDGNSSERFGTVWESVFLFQKAFQNLM